MSKYLEPKASATPQWAKDVPGWIKNQPWNILKIEEGGMAGKIFHDGIEGVGRAPMSLPARLWYGSPTWAKVVVADLLGRGAAFYEPQW
jgi:hypothetical protein